MPELKNILIRIIKIGIALTLFTPLILGRFSLNMSEYPKALFFKSLIEVLFVFYVFLVLIDKKYLPKLSPLFISVLAFTATLLITSFFGVNFYRSFFGDMTRGEGVILHIHLLLFFIIMIGVFLKRYEWMALFKTAVIISGISSFAAILQWLKIATFYDMEPQRVAGTLSNPDLLGSYLTLSIFLAVFLLAVEKVRWQKILWASLIVLNFWMLILSGTRGAWVGFGAGVLFSIACLYRKLDYKKRKIFLFTILALSVILLVVISFPSEFPVSQNMVFQRFTSMFEFNLGNRLALWKIGLAGFAQRPILGWGTETYAYVYDKLYNASYLNMFQSPIYFDRPHDKYVEILVSNGLLGIASYFLMFFLIFYSIFKYAKLWEGSNSRPKAIYIAIFGAFFITFLVQNIFLFDNICTYILFFLVAGFLNNNFSKPVQEKIIKKNPSAWLRTSKTAIALFTIIFTVIVFYKANVQPTMASMYFVNYIKYENTDIKKAFGGYLQGIQQNTIYDKDLRMAFLDRSLYFINNNLSDQVKGDIIEQFIKMRPIVYNDLKGKDQQMKNLYQFLFLMDEDSYLFSKDVKYLDNMESDMDEAIKFNPEFMSFYQLKAETKILQGKYEEAEELMKKARDSRLWAGEAEENEQGYFNSLAIAYFRKGDIKKTIENLEKEMGTFYERKKKNPSLTFDDPSSLFNLVNLIATFKIRDLKDREGFLNTYKEAEKYYPEYKQNFESFIKTLETQYP